MFVTSSWRFWLIYCPSIPSIYVCSFRLSLFLLTLILTAHIFTTFLTQCHYLCFIIDYLRLLVDVGYYYYQFSFDLPLFILFIYVPLHFWFSYHIFYTFSCTRPLSLFHHRLFASPGFGYCIVPVFACVFCHFDLGFPYSFIVISSKFQSYVYLHLFSILFSNAF